MLHTLIQMKNLRVRGLCANPDKRAISLIMNTEGLYQDMMSLRNYNACKKALAGNPTREALIVFSEMMEPEKEIDILCRNPTLFAIQLILDYYVDIVDWSVFEKTLCIWRDAEDAKKYQPDSRRFDDSFEGRVIEVEAVSETEEAAEEAFDVQEDCLKVILDRLEKNELVATKETWQQLSRNTCPFVLSVLFYSSETEELIDWEILSSNPVIFV